MGIQSRTITAAACSYNHFLAHHHHNHHPSCNEFPYVNITVKDRVQKHIQKRHGPYDCDKQYTANNAWNKPTIFFHGSDKVVRMTLIDPDVVTRGDSKNNYINYCKRFDFPVGIDSFANMLYICKVIVDVGKNKNFLVTAYPQRKHVVDTSYDDDCTMMCRKISETQT